MSCRLSALRPVVIVMDRRFRIVQKIVEREFAKRLRVKDVAKRLRLSASHFGRWFKRQAGVTFKRFVLALRMKRAKIGRAHV